MAQTIETTRTGTQTSWHGGRRTALHVAAEREAELLARTLGAQVRSARRARRWTQAQLGARVGLSQSRISSIEDGHGAGAPTGVWIALGIALGRPFAAAISWPLVPEPQDAGHLSAQELVLSLARRHGRPGAFELSTKPSDPSRSIDVGVRDDRRRVLIVNEISNRIDDLGQAVRDHRRKRAEAEGLAAVIGGDDGPYRVASCWIVRATAANCALVARYPRIIESTFPGSSRRWVAALVAGGDPPLEPSLVWADLAGTRIYEHRRAGSAGAHRRDG
ncbi:MAG: helix-turn-helix domain-containing protein [Chloroflexi bacterium]|nr:helix-turn-helix domain-containing protein [Chloroflexota bacterium]